MRDLRREPNRIPGCCGACAIDRLVLRQPDDWHVHLRDAGMLQAVANYTARQFARAIVMPNLSPPITDVAAAKGYRARIEAAVSPEFAFTALMTCYLTDNSNPHEIERGFAAGVFTACKLYPAHATTNAAQGVTDITKLYPVFERMQLIDMPLLLHGEVTDAHVDIFDREKVFIDTALSRLIDDFPGLRIVLEHITTADAVAFIEAAGATLAATITPHHLMINRNAMFESGLRPHFYCLPVAKRERHRLALRRAATSGSEKFFLGTDSAPHTVGAKQSACGCAGIFNALFELESYAQVFEEERALHRLEAFASEHGPRFYRMPLNQGHVVLERAPHRAPPNDQDRKRRYCPLACVGDACVAVSWVRQQTLKQILSKGRRLDPGAHHHGKQHKIETSDEVNRGQ